MSDKPIVAVYCRLAKKETPKAVIYCRVASADDFAIKAQEETLRNYAAEQLLAVGEVYSDNGANGLSFDRPAFQEMMSAIKKGEVDCVIVKSICRISRNYLQFGKWLYDMCSRNIRVIAVNDSFNSKDRHNLNKSFAETIEKYYKETHSQRIKAGIELAWQRKLELSAKPSK